MSAIKVFIPLFVLINLLMVGQTEKVNSNPNRYVDYGLLRVQGNLALGLPEQKNGGTNMYWVGDLDYYIKGNVSISSGFYYFLGSFNGDKLYKENHSAYLGASYHFVTNGHFDPFIGILPGYSINQLNSKSIVFSDTTKPVSNYPFGFNPLISINLGFNFYANRFFNVFVKGQYQIGKHYSDIAPTSLNELKVSFGLGYMIWARKKYFRFRKPNDNSQ